MKIWRTVLSLFGTEIKRESVRIKHKMRICVFVSNWIIQSIQLSLSSNIHIEGKSVKYLLIYIHTPATNLNLHVLTPPITANKFYFTWYSQNIACVPKVCKGLRWWFTSHSLFYVLKNLLSSVRNLSKVRGDPEENWYLLIWIIVVNGTKQHLVIKSITTRFSNIFTTYISNRKNKVARWDLTKQLNDLLE